MTEAVLALGIMALVALALWAQAHDWTPSESSARPSVAAFCAWCDWRTGDVCTNPDSPVGGQECGPVCAGEVRCSVRDVRW